MNSNWWANKLGTQEQPRESFLTPATVYKAVETIAAYTPSPAPARAPSDKGGSCPECRSGNYFSGGPSVRARCYDCGYPISQSSSGINTLVRPAGQVSETTYEATKQISTANNYNPTTIVDRV